MDSERLSTLDQNLNFIRKSVFISKLQKTLDFYITFNFYPRAVVNEDHYTC
jgi:hypothetical protein